MPFPQFLQFSIREPHESRPTRNEILEQAFFLLKNKDIFSDQEYYNRAAKLVKEAKKYGISSELRIVLDPKASDYTTGGFWQIDYGKTRLGFLPIENEQDVKSAIRFIKESRHQLRYEFLRKFAAKLLSCINHKKLSIPVEDVRYLEKLAGLGMSTKERIKEGLEKRAAALESLGYYKFSKELREIGNQTDGLTLDEIYRTGLADLIMNLVHNLDTLTKLAHHYGRGVTPPEDFLFDTTVSILSSFEREVFRNVKTGKVYRKKDVESKLDNVLLCHALDVGDCVEFGTFLNIDKLQNWVENASDEDARKLDRIFYWSGISPIIQRE